MSDLLRDMAQAPRPGGMRAVSALALSVSPAANVVDVCDDTQS